MVLKWPYVLTWEVDRRLLTAEWLSRRFADLVGPAGIAHCTLHDLRRSFSTLAQRAGIDAATVQKLGGWSSVDVVREYYTGSVTAGHRAAVGKWNESIA